MRGTTTGDRVPTGTGPAPDATIEVGTAGGVVTIRVAGEVDLTNAAWFAAVLDEALAKDPARLEVDLSAVTFLGCAAAASLATARRTARDLVVVAARDPVCRLLAIAGLAVSTSGADQQPTHQAH